MEFQWIRMFWLQGTRHAAQHDGYWTRRIEELTQAWDVMELGAFIFYLRRYFRMGNYIDVVFFFTGLRFAMDACARAADGKAKAEPRAFEMLRYLLETIAKLREEHDARTQSGAYAQVPDDCKPVDLPGFDDSSPLPRNLRPVLNTLERHRRRALDR